MERFTTWVSVFKQTVTQNLMHFLKIHYDKQFCFFIDISC